MNAIKGRILQGIVRHLLGVAGGFVISKGWLDGDTMQGLIGAAMGLVAIYFSATDKKDTPVASVIPVALPLDPSFSASATLPDDAEIFAPQTQRVPIVASAPEPPPKVTHLNKGFFLSERSKKSLEGVHPELVRVIQAAISTAPFDFAVIEGVRDIERQRELFTGKPKRSWTMKSNHLKQPDTGYGHAVDIAIFDGNKLDEDLGNYQQLNVHIQNTAHRLGVFELGWGGDWPVRDGMHWEWKAAE